MMKSMRSFFSGWSAETIMLRAAGIWLILCGAGYAAYRTNMWWSVCNNLTTAAKTICSRFSSSYDWYNPDTIYGWCVIEAYLAIVCLAVSIVTYRMNVLHRRVLALAPFLMFICLWSKISLTIMHKSFGTGEWYDHFDFWLGTAGPVALILTAVYLSRILWTVTGEKQVPESQPEFQFGRN